MTHVADEWFADESLWEALYPFIFSEAARAAAVNEVEAIGSLVGRPIDTLLDLCCGPGRHSVPFAKKGSRVTGVDRSAFLLERARHHASSEGVDVRWVHEDVRGFVEPGRFGTAVNLFTSFGYFEDPDDNQRVLVNVHESLEPGGVFVLDLMGKEVVARIYQPSRLQELPDGGLLVLRAKVIDGWSRIENDWTVVRAGAMRTFGFRHWLYSAVELRELLKDAGFVKIDMFGGLDGTPYGAEATRLVVRAQKAG